MMQCIAVYSSVLSLPMMAPVSIRIVAVLQCCCSVAAVWLECCSVLQCIVVRYRYHVGWCVYAVYPFCEACIFYL